MGFGVIDVVIEGEGEQRQAIYTRGGVHRHGNEP